MCSLKEQHEKDIYGIGTYCHSHFLQERLHMHLPALAVFFHYFGTQYFFHNREANKEKRGGCLCCKKQYDYGIHLYSHLHLLYRLIYSREDVRRQPNQPCLIHPAFLTTFAIMKRILASLLLLLTVAGTVSAISKKKPKPHFKLIEAYTKTIPETEQSNPPMEGHFFKIRWESSSYPETFFWRGEGGWFTCSIEATSKVKNVRTTKQITNDKIRKGDTLMLMPLTGGRFPIPAEIPETAKNTLYYKVAGSKWLAFPVKNITKK